MVEMRTPEGVPEPRAAEHRAAAAGTERVTWWRRASGSFLSATGLLALLLIGAQALWRGTLVVRGHFTQGDYLLPLEADGATLGWSYLVGEHAQEFSPVGRLVAWVTTTMGGTGWGAVVATVLVLQTIAALLSWVVLTQILDQRWVRFPLLAVALFSPLTLASTLSWSLASMHLPVTVLLLLGVSALLSHVRDGWEAGPLLAGVALTGMLLVSDRVLFMPLVVFVVVAAMLPGAQGALRRLAETATRYAALWIGLVVVLVARLLVGSAQHSGSFALPTDGNAVVDLLQAYLRQGLTGLVGGPWVGEVRGEALEPVSNWPIGLGVVLCLVCAVPLLRGARSAPVRLAVVGLAAHFVLGAGVLAFTREGFDALGAIPRFLADVVAVVVVLTAVALRGAVVPERGRKFVERFPALVALGLSAIFVASSAVTTANLAPSLLNTDDREYFTEVSKWLEGDPRIVLLDAPAPENIMHPWYEEEAQLSNLARLLPQRPPFDAPSEHLRMVDVLGILRTVAVQGVEADPGPDEGCGYMVTAERSVLRLPEKVDEGRVVMDVPYFTNGDAYVVAEFDEESIRIPVTSGLRNVQVPVEGGFDEFTVRLESIGDPVCLGQVKVGRPLPTSISEEE